MSAPVTAGSLVGLAALFDDVGALKRVRRAGTTESVATSLFFAAWRRAVAGEALADVARKATVSALVASQLGAIDGRLLARAGLDADERHAILCAAFDAAAGGLDPRLRAELRAAIQPDLALASEGSLPPFACALAEQPRAGATAPGTPRLVLEPAENHAEHCIAVGVYAMLVAPHFGSDGIDAFLFGIAHHLHNALLPDSGFAGELLLGPCLERVVDRFTEDALAELPRTLASRVRDVRAELAPAAIVPAARAFHAADVIDRVLQARHHARAAAFDIRQALGDRGLVHVGPVHRFHLEVLAEAGLP